MALVRLMSRLASNACFSGHFAGDCHGSQGRRTRRAPSFSLVTIFVMALRPEGDSRSLLDDVDTYDAVLDLADRIGVNIVPGES